VVDPRWSCFRKKTYPDERRAALVARAASERAGYEIRPYACPHCGLWHIGKAS
jgi:hypothetical protein